MKVVSVAVWSALSAVVMAIAVFLPVKTYQYGKTTAPTVLTLWQIDGFEGGVGSRSSFIKNVAADFEKSRNCLITVISETSYDASEKLARGCVPDVVSFSVGVDGVMTYARSCEKSSFFGGAEIGGKFYAKAWAAGGYVEITRKGVPFTKTIISKGKTTFPEIACAMAGIDISGAEYALPQRAYESFVSDKTARLIGTQRDLYRIKKRIDEYDIKPIEGFTDLIQYAAVTSVDEAKAKLSEELVSFLATEAQKKVNSLGLLSVDKGGNTASGEPISALFSADYAYTLSAFTDSEVALSINSELEKLRQTGGDNSDFLKSIVKLLK